MSDKSKDPPIEAYPEATPRAAQVIDLDGVRVAWGRQRGRKCEHKRLVYADDERRVWCEECERTIDNFDAFMVLVRHFQDMERAARSKMATAEGALKSSLHRRSAKTVERIWNRKGAIACPHCRRGILAEDMEHPLWVSGEMEIARRKKPPNDP